jgi:hemerythrin-like domain-containing protein
MPRHPKEVSVDNVVTLIKNDHVTFEWFFTQLEADDITPERAHELLKALDGLLTPHSNAEESVVYPAINKAVPKEAEETKDGAAEHHHAAAMMEQLLSQPADEPGADGIIAALIGELRHHIEEEEEDILPEYADAVDAAELDEVGRAFEAAKEQERVKGGYPEWPQPDVVDLTTEQLQTRATALDVEGRSSMTKDQLIKALR